MRQQSRFIDWHALYPYKKKFNVPKLLQNVFQFVKVAVRTYGKRVGLICVTESFFVSLLRSCFYVPIKTTTLPPSDLLICMCFQTAASAVTDYAIVAHK